MSQPPFDRLQALATSALGTGQMGASFSQLGEDRILWWIFGDRRDGFYVDVGCHHPYLYSNTALLHILNAWHGINIDVDERSIAVFNAIRPYDLNVCAAVGGQAARLELTLFGNGAVNTLDPSMAANPARAHDLIGKRMVDVLPLGEVLRQHMPTGQTIDVMNIDIEGLDFAALQSNDWDEYLPEVLAVEVHGFDAASPKSSPTHALLTSKGYRLLAYTVVTSIYRRHMP
jgi:methyltransferase FkbM-like protein